MLDRVFTTAGPEGVRFYPTPPPTDAEVARLLTTIRARILRRLRRRGLGPDAEGSRPDPVAEESPVLAGLSSASVQGRVALGPRAGARSLALGRDPEAEWVTSGGPRHAHVEGFATEADHQRPLGYELPHPSTGPDLASLYLMRSAYRVRADGS